MFCRYNVTVNCTVTLRCSGVCLNVNILIVQIFNASQYVCVFICRQLISSGFVSDDELWQHTSKAQRSKCPANNFIGNS